MSRLINKIYATQSILDEAVNRTVEISSVHCAFVWSYISVEDNKNETKKKGQMKSGHLFTQGVVTFFRGCVHTGN